MAQAIGISIGLAAALGLSLLVLSIRALIRRRWLLAISKAVGGILLTLASLSLFLHVLFDGVPGTRRGDPFTPENAEQIDDEVSVLLVSARYSFSLAGLAMFALHLRWGRGSFHKQP